MTDRHTTNTTPATELPTGGPICTTAAARAAGLDIPPAPAELAAMAGQIVRTTANPHGPEADLARAVPLMLEALADAQRERDEALARVAELERPEIEAKRNEIRSSYSELIAQAQQAGDHEGAFEVQCRLRDREAQWKTEDAARPTA